MGVRAILPVTVDGHRRLCPPSDLDGAGEGAWLAGAAEIAMGAEQHAMCAVWTDHAAQDPQDSLAAPHRAFAPFRRPAIERVANDNEGATAGGAARSGATAIAAVRPSALGLRGAAMIAAVTHLLAIGCAIGRIGARIAFARP